MKRLWHYAICGLLVLLLSQRSLAQVKEHGDFREEKKNVHSGNKIRTTFYNNGWLGRNPQSQEDIGGEWPINSGHEYIGDVMIFAGAEFVDRKGKLQHSVITPHGPQVGARTGERSPDRKEWWTWEALPGYANPDTNLAAMSHQKISWPAFWPDKLDDRIDPGWPGSWNGFFGKNVFNADQESYFVMDDYNDKEFDFYPDARDTLRRGLGIQGRVRGLQWSNVLAEDVLFWLYDFTNVGTHDYDKMVFGMVVGTITGGDGDTNDDNADFEKADNITYSYDFDNIGAGGWTPVGYAGYAFLESPGNPFDGIDNDNDGKSGPGSTITEAIFQPRALRTGDALVVIDYTTYERTVLQMPGDSLVIDFRGVKKVFRPGQMLEEIPRNNFDDNLDGLIDENNGSEIEIAPGVKQRFYLNVGFKYKNWLTGEGLSNLLIDERRDDGIDNDGDWNPLTDDLGLDGAFGTGDPGEGDGLPTSGRGTNLPGEPHIDKTDIDESDQIGLTSFWFFFPFNIINMEDDEKLWQSMAPGFFNSTAKKVDGDFIYGSGYFPLKAGDTERFSMGLVFGVDRDDIIRNKRTVQIIYNENYNFAKAPSLPTLTAVPGDGKVTLYWDDTAEFSFDALSGFDFEGYKLYRATDAGFEDAGAITNAYGARTFDKPIAIFDLKDGIQGLFPISFDGVEFDLGTDSGLRHSYVDVGNHHLGPPINGHTYFYAVTAYDRGELAREILPSETSKFAAIEKPSGRILTGINVKAVRPEAPAAGYVARPASVELTPVGQPFGTGAVGLEIVDERKIPDKNLYEVHFRDTATDGVDNDRDWRRYTDSNGNGRYDPGEPLNDDIGADGQPGTGDAGEGDGKPTPGEPRLDQRDLDEFVPMTTAYSVVNATDPNNARTVVDAPFLLVDYRDPAHPDTLVNRRADLDSRDFFDGMRVVVDNAWSVRVDRNLSTWVPPLHGDTLNYAFSVSPFSAAGIATKGLAYPRDYQIEFFNDLSGRSTEITLTRSTGVKLRVPSVATNFAVKDLRTGEALPYGFRDFTGASFIQPGFLSNLDLVILVEPTPDTTVVTWGVSFFGNDTTYHKPKAGDKLIIKTSKPFRSADVFRFESVGPKVDLKQAVLDLEKIKVVPNPYVVSATWEPPTLFTRGRGPRELHFTHMPKDATIRIYTVAGDLVATIEHHSTFDDGTAEWNMLTKDRLDIAYGVYVYHIEALDDKGNKIGERVGKFAVIK